MIFTSCAYRKQRYLRNIAKLSPDSAIAQTMPDYPIQPNDMLSVKFISYNKEVAELLNSYYASNNYTPGNTGYSYTMADQVQSGFIVSDSGYIKLPILGKVFVNNLTLEQVNKVIQTKLDSTVKGAFVFANLTGFKFSVLGEVNSPGVKTSYYKKLTILDAIALSSDINYYGNKKSVLLIRQIKSGYKTFRIDLTDPQLLTTNKFYLIPNDVIIVEPRWVKDYQLSWTNISILISLLSSFMVIYGYSKIITK